MDTTTLLIIVVVVLVVAFIMSRNRGTYGGNTYPRNTNTGPERPTYDDPNYTSTGSIGGTEVERRRFGRPQLRRPELSQRRQHWRRLAQLQIADCV